MSKLLNMDLGKDSINNKLLKGLRSCDEVTDDLIINRYTISHVFYFNKKKDLDCITLIDYF